MDTSNQHRVIVGIDFGTTYTGVSWIKSDGSRTDPYTLENWPNNRENKAKSSSPKVPTKLRYLDSGEFEWGYYIPTDAQPQSILSLFKLGLELDKYQNSLDVIGIRLSFENVDKNITDYLSGVYEFCVNNMREGLGDATFSNSTINFVLTVPAIWSEVSKQRTMEAFAKIPNLPRDYSATLLSEPEAAAIAALRDIDRHGFRVNDSFVVVDAGGGTVDLITYTITSLVPGLEVSEATEGTGDFCGSSRINDRFIQFLTSRLGGEEGWSDEVLNGAVQHFESQVKPMFNMSALAQNRTFLIPVDGLGINYEVGIHRRGRLVLPANQVHLFFEPDIIKIIQLVKDQIAMAAVTIKKILLVGGYGSSIYLRERLEVAVRDDSSIASGIEVLQPPNPWTSVVRGAAMKGLSQANPVNFDVPIVRARTARKHYGYSCGKVFNPEEHESLRSEKYWDGRTGCWRVLAMDWIIKRGELVSENKPFLRTYYYTRPVEHGRPHSITTSVYSDHVSGAPPVGLDKNVQLLCHVIANLDSIPENELEQVLGADKRMYYELEVQIESIYLSASTEYTLIYKGQRYGTVTAEYV